MQKIKPSEFLIGFVISELGLVFEIQGDFTKAIPMFGIKQFAVILDATISPVAYWL
jgi:hypothetical protein